jgi:2',3'-cyclic-nucleotide 2'-phosphodiesterase (5'-nucleotidase family)
MKAFEIFEKSTKLISESFMVRAIGPWVFVLLLDLAIYEFCVPDGRSLVTEFLRLPDGQLEYALIGLAAWLIAVTSFFDNLAGVLANLYRNRAAAANPLSDNALPFEIKLWWAEATRQPASTKLADALGNKIDETLTATLRYANLAIALAVSIWPMAWGLATYQHNASLRVAIILVLGLLMVGSLYLARRQLDNLAALDWLRRRLPEQTREPLQASSSSKTAESAGYAQLSGFSIAAAVIIALLVLVAWPVLYLLCSGSSRDHEADAEHLTIITVNDVYRLDGVNEGEAGGLARLRTLRKDLEAEGRQVILLHAGDFLSPSLIGKVLKGKQMVDVMNHLDGNKNLFDDRMFVIFGNHEFDDSRCESVASVLDDRVNQSQFTWLNSNLDFASCFMMSSIAAQRKVREDFILNVGTIRVGLFGIGLTPEGADNAKATSYPKFEDNADVAAGRIRTLRANGADFIIAVTHLNREDDQKLLDEFGSKGLNLIVGGHDHECMTLTARDGSAYGFKADSDAKTAWRIDLDFPASGKPSITRRVYKLDQSIRPDPDVASRSKEWKERAERDICTREQKMPKRPDCLDDRIGSTRTDLELDESANRSRETGFGDWLADVVRDKTKADVALINSGTLGFDETIRAGSKLNLRQLKDIFRFDDNVATRDIPVKAVCRAIEHGFKVPGKGAWPHISGVRVALQNAAGGKKSAKVLSFDKRADLTCDSEDNIKIAGLPYLLCDGDGYEFGFPGNAPDADSCRAFYSDEGKQLKAPETDNNFLFTIAREAFKAAGDAGIDARTDGRVSTPAAAAPSRPPICDNGKSETSQYR